MNNEPLAPRPSPALADLFIPERTDEIAFWTELAMGYGRVVANWHCGTGELAIGLAKNGLRVVGVDPNSEAIEIARAREASVAEELMLTWLCREPRLVSLPGPVDFAVISGDIFGTYLDSEQRLGLLNNLFDHMRPGGALGIVIALCPTSGLINSKAISGPLRRLPKGIFARRVSTLRYDAERALLSTHHNVMVRLPDGEQHFEEDFERHLYSPDEIFALLRQVGFISIGMWGGWDSRPLRQANGWFIVRAERPLHRPVGKLISTEKAN